MPLNSVTGYRILYVILFLSLFSCKSKQDKSDPVVTVLVRLEEKATVAALENDFSEYNLAFEKLVSRPTNIYLFSYDQRKITIARLLQELKASELVKEAQENRNVQTRNIN
tara:strand:- start:42910 stop:43242 length:333 start_codon:yes stop_codon:yes gene_type:complete